MGEDKDEIELIGKILRNIWYNIGDWRNFSGSETMLCQKL